MFADPIFRGSGRNFTIGQSPTIWGNFAKISSKIKKIEKPLRIREKMHFSENF